MYNERRITKNEQRILRQGSGFVPSKVEGRKTKNEIKARARWDEGAFSPELVAPIPTRAFIS